MAKFNIFNNVTEDITIWRYISLDKLIDLLHTRTLFFTPLTFFQKTDPFEGYIPKVGLIALREITQKIISRYDDPLDRLQKMAEGNSQKIELVNNLRDSINLDIPEKSKEAYSQITKRLTINCWYSSVHESEAMWKIYSSEGNGIAIRTSVAQMKRAIESEDQEIEVNCGAIKYLDFYDETLKPSDCIVAGYLSPLVKRISFAHENEIRLFINSSDPIVPQNEFNPKPIRVKIDPQILIDEILISPMAKEPFISASISVCEMFGISNSKIRQSNLITMGNSILDTLDINISQPYVASDKLFTGELYVNP